MARTSKRTDIKIPKQKPLSGPGWEAAKFIDEYLIPKTPLDAATSWGFAKVGSLGYKGAKAGVKKIIKVANKNKKVTPKTKKVTKTTKKK